MDVPEVVNVVMSGAGAALGAYVAARAMGVKRLVELVALALRPVVASEVAPLEARMDTLEARVDKLEARDAAPLGVVRDAG
ncbi:hypothetical protein [Corallococcus silvisoli]|uniref:hypothetical protein n=1 Tax=Corallococcus silvisoli TaxID=2697031 RepID=UPI001377F14E|nr:hypothetical protein [Corallococcus silvisoli]NBD09632.1 hypothetical protein [Corallococcus silvisoli]